MSGYATRAESLDISSSPAVYSATTDNQLASSVYSEIADDPSSPSVYSEIIPSQIYNDIVTVSSTSVSSFAFDTEDSNLSSQSGHRY